MPTLFHDPLSSSPPLPCTVEIHRTLSSPPPSLPSTSLISSLRTPRKHAATYLQVYGVDGTSLRRVVIWIRGEGKSDNVEVHVAPCTCAIDSTFFAFSELTSPTSPSSVSTTGTTKSTSRVRNSTLTHGGGPKQSHIASLHKFTIVGSTDGLPITLMFESHEEMEGWVNRISDGRSARGSNVTIIPMSPNPLLADYHHSLTRSPKRPEESPGKGRFFASSPLVRERMERSGNGTLTPPRLPPSAGRGNRRRGSSFSGPTSVLSPSSGPRLRAGRLTPTPSTRRQSTLNSFQLQYLTSASSPLSPSPPSPRSSWSNTPLCEICSSPFALLHRRHHCRSCLRCVCSDCSISLYMPGVVMKVRICNRCEHEYTEQLKTLNETGRKTTEDMAGKCHGRVSALRVKPGRVFPGFREYFRGGDKRPGIGRVTVQVVEAMSLPPADANGKADPYCRVTVTGYSRVPEKPTVSAEWVGSSRFSMDTTYVSATLCPVWRGAVFTLPVVRSEGCVVRFEVFDYDAIGSHTMLGILEVPMEDLPLAEEDLMGRGEVDNWYEMSLPGEVKDGYGVRKVDRGVPYNMNDVNGGGVKSKGMGINSAKQLLNFTGNALSEPIVFLSKLTGSNLKPIRIPTSKNASVKKVTRPKIRVKIKLCLNPYADVLSHSWMPPTEPPPRDKFDLQSLIRYGVKLEKLVDPHIKFMVNFVNSCRWVEVDSDTGKILVKAERDDALRFCKWLAVYFLHVLVGFRVCFILLHCYLFRFLVKVKVHGATSDLTHVELASLDREGTDFPPLSRASSFAVASEDGVEGSEAQGKGKSSKGQEGGGTGSEPQLNHLINWIAKKFGNKALDTVQNSLRNYIDLVNEFHSIYDGTDLDKTNGCLLALIVSAYLVYRLSATQCVVLYSLGLLFVVSPMFPRTLRIVNGVGKGVGCYANRKRLKRLYEEAQK